MEITDHIIVNMLKKQLIDIYEKYTASPEMLGDPNILYAYNLLVKANTKDELKRWQLALINLGLSFISNDAIERKDNLLGKFGDTLSRADDSAIEAFILWKRSITPAAWVHARQCSLETVRMLEEAVSGSFKAHIVLFKCGKQWAAIGIDADRLFEIFGWQTGYVDDGEVYVSWMYVTEYGMKVLENSKYTVEVLDLGKVDVVSTAFTEDLVSSIQQYTDYLRDIILKSGKLHKKLEKELPLFLGEGFQTKGSVSEIDIDGNIIMAVINSPKEGIVFSDSRNWRTDDIGIPLILSLVGIIGSA